MEKYTYSNGGTVKAGKGQFYAEAYSRDRARRIAACLTVLDCVPIDELEKAGTGMMSDAAVKVGELTEKIKLMDDLITGIDRYCAMKPNDTNCQNVLTMIRTRPWRK